MNFEKIRVITKEKELFLVDMRATNYCRTFSKLLEDSSPTEDIPIDIDSKTFKIILSYLDSHSYQEIKELPKPLQTGNIAKLVSEGDYQLMLSLNEEERYNLILVFT